MMNHIPELDRLFRVAFAPNGVAAAATTAATRRLAIPVDVREESERFVLEADLPGFTREQIRLTFEEGVLVLAGERKPVERDQTSTAHRLERAWGAFERKFTLPQEVDAAAIEAQFENGVLTVVLPKKAVTKPRSIEIKTR